MTDEELRQLIESNARAIQGNSEGLAELRRDREASRRDSEAANQQLRESIEASRRDSEAADLRLRESIEEGRQRSEAADQRLRESIEATHQHIRESIDDTISLVANLAQQLDESDQKRQENEERFNILLAEARADRQRSDERAAANETERRAFQQIVQTLLAEINRIWQRLAS
ncbi:MAG: hypothetical protein AAGD09_04170 [Cyanobacteria bacterium P01_F01_bin.56]